VRGVSTGGKNGNAYSQDAIEQTGSYILHKTNIGLKNKKIQY
jgi:hypothetical protein